MNFHTNSPANEHDPKDNFVDISESQIRGSSTSMWCVVSEKEEEYEELFEDMMATGQLPLDAEACLAEVVLSSLYTGPVVSAASPTAPLVSGDDSFASTNVIDSGKTQTNGFLLFAQESLTNNILSNIITNNDTVNDISFFIEEHKRLSLENEALRLRLAEADHRVAHYVHLCEVKDDEMRNMHKTLSLLIHDDKNDILKPSYEVGTTELKAEKEKQKCCGYLGHADVSSCGYLLNVADPPFLSHSTSLPGLQISCPENFLEKKNGSAASDAWAFHFASAKFHASSGEAVPAIESLLFAITSEDFDAWDSLLADDSEWNNLSECDRWRWDTLLVDRIAETLKKHNVEGNLKTAARACGKCDEGNLVGRLEKKENLAARTSIRHGSLCAQLLASFIWRLTARYERRKRDYVTAQVGTRDTAITQKQAASHYEVVCIALEKLLLLSLSLFPNSAELFYLLAALRAIQGRSGESLELLQQAVGIDPLCLLCMAHGDY